MMSPLEMLRKMTYEAYPRTCPFCGEKYDSPSGVEWNHQWVCVACAPRIQKLRELVK